MAMCSTPVTCSDVVQKQTITLVGRTTNNIAGDKLPSRREILQVLLYNVRFVNLPLQESANLVLNAVKVLSMQARIPVITDTKIL